MKHYLAMALLALPFLAHAEDNYGTYTNGKVTLIYELGYRGGDLFYSSACKGVAFTPAYNAAAQMFEDRQKNYVIYFQGMGPTMEVESTYKCFPEGRYKRISN